jgi:formate dehydrogenase accessory protein FdhD
MNSGAAEALPPPSRAVLRTAFRSGERTEGWRSVPEEVAVALTYGGSTQAVMLATPADLHDFAVGFSLTERIIAAPPDIEAIDVVPTADGIDIQMWLTKPRDAALAVRRRHMAGPTGCGLCGVDSLAEAMRRPPTVGDDLRLDDRAIQAAIGALAPRQALHRETGAVHAAGFWRAGDGLVCAREDVGRHNALDKLVGALARRGERGAGGVLLLTSRVSVEMVQKAAVLGAEILVAVSAPTALAIRIAEAAGVTLVAVARPDGFEVFTHSHRICGTSEAIAELAGFCDDAAPRSGRTRAGRSPLLTIDEALATVVDGVVAIDGEERVAPAAAAGRIAAETVATPVALPRFDHSAMDGYGVSAADCDRPPPLRLALVGKVVAGGSPSHPVGPGEAVRLLTGAPIPDGVAGVLMEEHCRATGGMVEIGRPVSRGMNIRLRGEDVSAGVTVVSAGAMIGTQHVPILSACGIQSISVRRKLRVAILSTGNEVARPGEPLSPSGVYDVNRPMLQALLCRPWIELVDLGIVTDDARLLAEVIGRAVASADLVATSGGVSGSDADHIAAAVGAAGGSGRVLRIAIKPGKPLFIGRVGAVPVLGLPGNPLSALADFLLFGRPLLRLRAGHAEPAEPAPLAVLAAPVANRSERTEIVPASIVGRDPSGLPAVAVAQMKGSARLHPLASASGLAIIPASAAALAAGERVSFLSLRDCLP